MAIVIAASQILLNGKSKRGHTVLAEKSNIVAISTPDNILDWRGSQFRKDLLLLNIEQSD